MDSKTYKESLLPPLWILVLILVSFSIWLLGELKEIVALVVVSYAAAYLIEPLLRILEKQKISRPIGFFVLMGIALAVLAVLVLTVLPVLQREFLQLVENFPTYLQTAKETVDPWLHKAYSLIGHEVAGEDKQSIVALAKDFMPKVWSGLQATLLQGYSITLTVINLTLLPFMIFYISMGFKDYRSFFNKLLPEQSMEKANSIIDEIDFFVSGFVRGQLIVSFIMFVMYACGLGIIGVELWFLLAVIAGFGNLVPYLGTITGILLASIMSLITFGDWLHLFYVWGVFAVVQFLEGTFITPKILGDKVGLSPLAVILAIFIGGKLFGLLGIFLAVPGAAIFKVLSTHFHAWLISKV